MIRYQFLAPIGTSLLRRLKTRLPWLSQEDIEILSKIPRFMLFYALACQHINDNHPGFGITFVSGEQKAEIPKLTFHRMNMPNGYHAKEVKFPFSLYPKINDKRWKKFFLKDLKKPEFRNGDELWGIPIPMLQAGNVWALYNLVLGNFR